MYGAGVLFLCVDLMSFGIVGPAEKVIDGDVEIIGKADQGGIISLSLFVFVSADGILIHMKMKE